MTRPPRLPALHAVRALHAQRRRDLGPADQGGVRKRRLRLRREICAGF